jgi:hypothetical protein
MLVFPPSETLNPFEAMWRALIRLSCITWIYDITDSGHFAWQSLIGWGGEACIDEVDG